ncbi:alpha-L-rhamnosidase C-terminal domain-containing protein [Paenibacillus sp. FSL K6-1566]|uniref:alpha-L-rhamnosidase-related protein n=1 Tax=Paenibacillus sp. FSL K6-1566 TaxID=2954515 RepID=UPI003100FB11
MEPTGGFSCSNPLINKLVDNTLWSMKSNFLDVPTDCPQRERAAWTGDAQVFFVAGSYLMNTAPFIRKWMRDLQDAQTQNGLIPNIVPTIGSDPIVDMMQGSVGWADAAVLIPYRYWKLYGDTAILDDNREMMQKYAAFMEKRAKKRNPLRLLIHNPYRRYTYEVGKHWGEWAEPAEEKFESVMSLGFPRPEEATAYYAYVMRLMHEISQKNNWPLENQYKTNAIGGKKAYNHLFVKKNDIDSIRPSKLVRPLALGLLDEEARKRVAKRLDKLMKSRDYRVGTGFLSTPFLLPVLDDNGYLDTAYATLEQEEAPGWLYQVKNGATTIWEHWTGFIEGKQYASLNHYTGGSVCEWLFSSVAGIRTTGISYHFVIKPMPGRSLTQAMASYDSIYGMVRSGWYRKNEQVEFIIEIPPNCTADIHLPDGKSETVGAGQYFFKR